MSARDFLNLTEIELIISKESFSSKFNLKYILSTILSWSLFSAWLQLNLVENLKVLSHPNSVLFPPPIFFCNFLYSMLGNKTLYLFVCSTMKEFFLFFIDKNDRQTVLVNISCNDYHFPILFFRLPNICSSYETYKVIECKTRGKTVINVCNVYNVEITKY